MQTHHELFGEFSGECKKPVKLTYRLINKVTRALYR
jgi:hypothetical protein